MRETFKEEINRIKDSKNVFKKQKEVMGKDLLNKLQFVKVEEVEDNRIKTHKPGTIFLEKQDVRETKYYKWIHTGTYVFM